MEANRFVSRSQMPYPVDAIVEKRLRRRKEFKQQAIGQRFADLATMAVFLTGTVASNWGSRSGVQPRKGPWESRRRREGGLGLLDQESELGRVRGE